MPGPSPNDKALDPLSCPCNGDCHKDRTFAHGSCCQTIGHLPMDSGVRDHIRRALCNIDGKGYLWGTDMMEPDEYGDQADAIMRLMTGDFLIPVAVDRREARNDGQQASCGPDCYETNVEPHPHRWAQSVYSINGTRTVRIPYLDANGHEAGSVEVHHGDVRTLALMLCDDATRIADPSSEPETDEERADRLETESEHAANIHTHCGVTCEEEFPSIMLRNTILVRTIPGSATMLDELIRRASQSSDSQ